MKRILPILFLFFCVFLSPKSVFAQVVINEFSSFNNPGDWVEIYNDSPDSIDLSYYIIRDFTKTQKVPLSGILASKSFTIFDLKDYLNKNGDVIKLIHITDGVEDTQPVMTVCYGDKVKECAVIKVGCYSLENGSIGSYPSNGGNIFERFATDTKNNTNENAQLDPCPTPTETITENTTEITTTIETPTPTPAKAVYKINEPKDQDGQPLTGVKIYIDNLYTHHEDNETLEFCDSCFCDNDKIVPCGFGEHTVKLTKTGYSDWSVIRNFTQGTNDEVTPILTKISESTPNPTVSPTSTQTPASTSTPTKAPTITLKTNSATSSSTVSAVLGESTDSASISSEFIANIESTPPTEKKVNKPTNYKTPFFIGLFLAISSGALLYFRHRKD